MKRIVLFFCFLALPAVLSAQQYVDRLYFDMRASFHQDITDGVYNSQAIGEHLNFQMLGHITPKIDYRIRQRLNKKDRVTRRHPDQVIKTNTNHRGAGGHHVASRCDSVKAMTLHSC